MVMTQTSLPAAMRPEFIVDLKPEPDIRISTPVGLWERLGNQSVLRKALILITLAVIWQAYGAHINDDLLFPRLTTVVEAFANGVTSGALLARTFASLRILLVGYAMGAALAAVLTVLAISSRFGSDLLQTLTSMLSPLPSIALLPLALIWFGIGNQSMIFVLIHSVVWIVALNAQSGFLAVSRTLRMVGWNCGLKGIRFVALILVPAAFPSILSGLKIGWAFAWRTLIAAELVFGVSSGQGGLGWYIFQNKTVLQIPNVFAGLLMVILIGLLVENLVFSQIERLTVRRWGMQS